MNWLNHKYSLYDFPINSKHLVLDCANHQTNHVTEKWGYVRKNIWKLAASSIYMSFCRLKSSEKKLMYISFGEGNESWQPGTFALPKNSSVAKVPTIIQREVKKKKIKVSSFFFFLFYTILFYVLVNT